VACVFDPKRMTLREDQGATAGGQPPAEMARLVRSEVQRWGKVVKDAGVKIDN